MSTVRSVPARDVRPLATMSAGGKVHKIVSIPHVAMLEFYDVRGNLIWSGLAHKEVAIKEDW